MRRALHSFPSKLDEAFESSLRRIDSQSSSRSALAHRVIGWITNSERRLTTAELIQGLAVEEGSDEVDEENLTTIDTILRACVGLVILNREDDTVGMVHTTAYEWFHSRKSGLYHEDLVNTCLLYLTSRPMCANTEEMAKRVQKMLFLLYAARYWGRHIRSEDVERKFSGMINRLLEKPKLRSTSFQALHYRNQLKDHTLTTASFETIPSGHDALNIAAYWSLKLTVAALLRGGINPSTQDSQKWTPLHWACFNESSEVVDILLFGGAGPNVRDSVGWTPIFWATFNGNMTLVQLLLENSSDHMVRDIHGWSALKWAMARHETGIAKALLRHHERCLRNLSIQPKVMLKN